MSLLEQLGYLIPTLSRPYPGQKLVVPCPYPVLIPTLLQPYPNLIPSLSRPYPNLISSLSRPYVLKKMTNYRTLIRSHPIKLGPSGLAVNPVMDPGGSGKELVGKGY